MTYKKLKSESRHGKKKLGEMPTKMKVAWMCLLATVCPAYCDINGAMDAPAIDGAKNKAVNR